MRMVRHGKMFSVRFLMVCGKGLDGTQQGFLGNSAAQDGLIQRQRSMNQLPRRNALTADSSLRTAPLTLASHLQLKHMALSAMT